MYDIKSFAIGAFLTSLLLKEQMMISGKKRKKPCARQYQASKRDRKTSGAFEHKKSPVLKRQHL